MTLSQQLRALLQAQDGVNFICKDLAQKNHNVQDKPTSYLLRCNGTFVDYIFSEVNKKHVQVDGGDIANLLHLFIFMFLIRVIALNKANDRNGLQYNATLYHQK